MSKKRKISRQQINEALVAYQRALLRYGPNNLETIRAEMRYRELRKAIDSQRHSFQK